MTTVTAAELKSMTTEQLEKLRDALNAEMSSLYLFDKQTSSSLPWEQQPARLHELHAQHKLVLNRIHANLAAVTRERNAAFRAANAVTGFTVGQRVAFRALGFTAREYEGTVVKVGRTGKVTVEYVLLNGKTKQKAVDATSGIRSI